MNGRRHGRHETISHAPAYGHCSRRQHGELAEVHEHRHHPRHHRCFVDYPSYAHREYRTEFDKERLERRKAFLQKRLEMINQRLADLA